LGALGALEREAWPTVPFNTIEVSVAYSGAVPDEVEESIIVDDAIVVAEYIHYERKRGLPGVVAAIRGTRRIKNALIFAVLTLVAAFTPLLFIPGGIGEI